MGSSGRLFRISALTDACQKDLEGGFTPCLNFTGCINEIRLFLTEDLLGSSEQTRTRCQLQLPVNEIDEWGNRQNAAHRQCPPKGAAWWTLEVGQLDQRGMPTGVGMKMVGWELFNPEQYTGWDPALVTKCLEQPDLARPLMRHGDERAVFSAEQALAWDQSKDFTKPRGKFAKKWTHFQRWQLFVGFVRMIWAVRRQEKQRDR